MRRPIGREWIRKDVGRKQQIEDLTKYAGIGVSRVSVRYTLGGDPLCNRILCTTSNRGGYIYRCI